MEHESMAELPSIIVVTYAVCCQLFKWTSTGTIATKAVVLIGTIAAIAVDLSSVLVCIRRIPLGGPKARQDLQRGLHTSRLFFVTSHFHSFLALLLHSWRPSVPSSTRAPQLEVGTVEACAKLHSPRHTCCLAKRTLPIVASFALAPLPVAEVDTQLGRSLIHLQRWSATW